MATATTHPPLSEPAKRATTVASAVETARVAQQAWQSVAVAKRLQVIHAVRQSLVDEPNVWAEEITDASRRTIADSLAAEVLPMADACQFLQRNTERILREAKLSRRDRPIWGRGLRVRIRREPRGVVLVIGAWNYPLFLAGVQTLQAIAAGNAVLVKPAVGCSAAMQRLAKVIEQAGAPAGLVQVLDESPAAAQQAIELGVNQIVMTGSAATGRAVLKQAAETLTPCTLELSGCDAVFVLPGADLVRVSAALAFGLRLNGSATCIGPRRVFVVGDQPSKLIEKLSQQLSTLPPVAVPEAIAGQARELVDHALAAGAKPIAGSTVDFSAERFPPVILQSPTADLPLMKADLFAPVMSIVRVGSIDEAIEADQLCPYGLGASVFGPAAEAELIANRIEAGCVTVNDLVAPTADPRVAFGGWNDSGYGVTRGAEGLLVMTRPKTVITQRARWLPHLDPPRLGLDRLIISLLRLSHGKSIGQKFSGLREVISSSRNK